VERSYTLPAYGERMTLYAESTGLEGTVFGQPQSRDVPARVRQYEPPWWQRVWSSLRILAAIGFGAIVGYTIGRVLP
jgi:hypothetical protein